MKLTIDMTGQRFGRLTVTRHAGSAGTAQHAKWECVCDCGNRTVVIGASIRAGRTRSCGCLARETRFDKGSAEDHGMSGSRTYRIWAGMKRRCKPGNTGNKAHLYAGKGITVCDEWQSFPRFLADMGEAPPGLTLDRRNGDLGYYKDNCRWATRTEQANNTSCNVRLTHEGRTQTVAQWAADLGLKSNTLIYRIRRGLPVEQVLTTAALVRAATLRAAERNRPCAVCGKVFLPRPAQLREGRGRFCSHACQGAARRAVTIELLADEREFS